MLTLTYLFNLFYFLGHNASFDNAIGIRVQGGPQDIKINII